MADVRDFSELHDGFEDGLTPLELIDLNKCKTVDDLVRAMSRTAFAARNMGEAADVLESMFADEECFVVLTLSGAMTIAKMQLIFVELIERGWVNAIVSTGALIAHGFIEGTGMKHFKHTGDMNDHELYQRGYDRVYDTLELEKNFHEASLLIDDVFDHDEYDNTTFTSPEICRIIGNYLIEKDIGGRSVLKSAVRKGVPVFVPALCDSELGLDLISLRYPSRRRKRQNNVKIEHSSFGDVKQFADLMEQQTKMGIFTIGGGVPRNWAQQISPFLELKNEVYISGEKQFPRYYYGVRICPEPVHWGGLSGCTYSEGMSWGKFNPEGKFSEVLLDATVALPILIKALMERFDSKK